MKSQSNLQTGFFWRCYIWQCCRYVRRKCDWGQINLYSWLLDELIGGRTGGCSWRAFWVRVCEWKAGKSVESCSSLAKTNLSDPTEPLSPTHTYMCTSQTINPFVCFDSLCEQQAESVTPPSAIWVVSVLYELRRRQKVAVENPRVAATQPAYQSIKDLDHVFKAIDVRAGKSKSWRRLQSLSM